MSPITLHGTTVALKGNAVLILGKPGMGKSSLALELIDRGACLVADDQTCLSLDEGVVYASCPLPLKGLIEIYGIGICPLPSQDNVPLSLMVEICEPQEMPRLPNPTFVRYHGVQIPSLKMAKHDPLASFKVEIKLDLSREGKDYA